MVFQNILLAKDVDTAVLTINRPAAMNALNMETLLEINKALEDIQNDANILALIITGAGKKAFVAGADISYMKNLTALQAREFGLLGQKVFQSIETLNIPCIAAVNGFALGGGCELALACDFRIASTKAKFGQPEVGLGIIPGFSGTQRLPRLISPGMAKQLLYTGQTIDAAEALRIGIVNQVAEPEELIPLVMEIADKIKNNAKLAIQFCKNAINAGLQTDIDRGMTIEADLFGICFTTDDQLEGMTAFLEKRKPNFTGS
ncbi:MAG TPA: short-chain-enoyl-CoA hydratase [Syntrophomonadaceae bacterium]|nr:short-chain-enoyl-CoA hydratase [Syntrophomonadaceae bacterium]